MENAKKRGTEKELEETKLLASTRMNFPIILFDWNIASTRYNAKLEAGTQLSPENSAQSADFCRSDLWMWRDFFSD